MSDYEQNKHYPEYDDSGEREWENIDAQGAETDGAAAGDDLAEQILSGGGSAAVSVRETGAEKEDLGFRIFFSILEMFFLNPLSLLSGIVSLVYTIRAHGARRDGRIREARRRRMIAKRWLIAGFAGLSLNFIFWFAKQAEKGRFYMPDQYYELMLEGQKLSIPVSVKEFRGMGFVLDDSAAEILIGPGEKAQVSFGDASFPTDDGVGLGTAVLYNSGADPVTADSADVIGITIYNLAAGEDTGENGGDSGTADEGGSSASVNEAGDTEASGTVSAETPAVKLAGGLTFDSDRDEVSKVFRKLAKTDDDTAVRSPYDADTYVLHGWNYAKNLTDQFTLEFIREGEDGQKEAIFYVDIQHMAEDDLTEKSD